MISFIREDGLAFEFTGRFGILSLEGATEHNIEIATVPKAVGHGDLITGRRMGGRIITIEAEALKTVLIDESRHELRAYFSPFKNFKIFIDYKGERVWQNCVINSIALPTANIYEPQKVKLSVFCAEPWWNSSEPEVVQMYKNQPLFGFPFLSTSIGVPFGIDMYSTDALINNRGDLEAYCKVRFNFVTMPSGAGSVTWFKLIKNNLEYIQLNKIMNLNEVWEIDFEKRIITCNGENANRFVDNSSTFFTIDQGGSSISYLTSDVRGRAECTFTMYERFL